jgi:hypothetical protein
VKDCESKDAALSGKYEKPSIAMRYILSTGVIPTFTLHFLDNYGDITHQIYLYIFTTLSNIVKITLAVFLLSLLSIM